MSKEFTFRKANQANLMKINLLLPKLVKEYGDSHPEILEVKKVFEGMKKKTMAAMIGRKGNPELSQEFASLRQLTTNYTVPKGVNDNFEALYKAFEEADRVYKTL
ncbi:MAG: hypothetical protein GX323_10140 [Clostridiales bacterium]|nr:hypothetical protein [Clostridiales bacterium]